MALAERYNGEIINGDALQMYEGLPVTTNKISFEERRSIPHHLLGCVKCDDEPWIVGKFKNQAIKIIEEIRSRGKLPILVGGTHYYTQSLLFKHSIVEDENEDSGDRPTGSQIQTWPILAASTYEIFEELKKVDPLMAARWHPHDRRKIQRSLEIWYMTGRRASDIYEEQRTRRSNVTFDQDANEGFLGNEEHKSTERFSISPLRYDSLILWTHSSSEELKSRLDKRVDKMLTDGLLSEVGSMNNLYRDLKSVGQRPAVGQGIWIAIGYKEFVPYFQALQTDKSPENLKALKEEGVTRTKAHSRQYARRQVRWIRTKLIHALQYSNLSHTLFLLDGSDLSRRAIDVEGQASDLVAAFLRNEPLPEPTSLSEVAEDMLQPSKKEKMFAKYCKTCAKTLMSEKEWHRHVNGKPHKRAQKAENKRWERVAKVNQPAVRDVSIKPLNPEEYGGTPEKDSINT